MESENRNGRFRVRRATQRTRNDKETEDPESDASRCRTRDDCQSARTFLNDVNRKYVPTTATTAMAKPVSGRWYTKLPMENRLE